MARPLVKKDVQQRVKENKAVMKAAKRQVTDAMNAAMKGEEITAAVVRSSLADFLKAFKAVQADTAKLDTA